MNRTGLIVKIVDNKYIVQMDEEEFEYPIGSLMTEYYSTFRPIWIREYMIQLRKQNENKELDIDGAVEVLLEAYHHMQEVTGKLAAYMFFCEIFNGITVAIYRPEEMRTAINSLGESEEDNSIYLRPAGIESFSIDNLGDALYVSYYFASINFVMFLLCFEMITSIPDDAGNRLYEEEEGAFDGISDEEKLKRVMNFYSEKKDVQDIACRIVLHGKGFVHEYEVTNSLSLLLFDFANVARHKPGTAFCVCKNCGRIFVPTGRADTKYCNYASPQDKTKTCSEIGPQIARARKIETDKATHEYRKLYMRLKMQEKRHPDETRYVDLLAKLVAEGKVWRKRLEDEPESMGKYYDWLASFEGQRRVTYPESSE